MPAKAITSASSQTWKICARGWWTGSGCISGRNSPDLIACPPGEDCDHQHHQRQSDAELVDHIGRDLALGAGQRREEILDEDIVAGMKQHAGPDAAGT